MSRETFRFIANASWSSNVANILTELPHDLKIGSQVEIKNIVSENNPVGTANSGFNGNFNVTGITSAREFTVSLVSSTGPGAFTNDTSARTTSLPTFTQKRTKGTYQVYRSQQIQRYVAGEQDGIYHLLIVNNSNSVQQYLLSLLKGSLRIFNNSIPRLIEIIRRVILTHLHRLLYPHQLVKQLLMIRRIVSLEKH